MADKYTPERATSGKEWLRTWWKKVENNFTKIFGAVNKHIDGTADRHTADMVDYSDTETVKAKFDTKVDKVSGKGLVDETDIRTAVQSGDLTFADGKKISLSSSESDNDGTLTIRPTGISISRNTSMGTNDIGVSTYSGISIGGNGVDVSVNTIDGKHYLSEKANTADVFLPSKDITLESGKKISIVDGNDTIQTTLSGEEIKIAGKNNNNYKNTRIISGDVEVETYYYGTDGYPIFVTHKLSEKIGSGTAVMGSTDKIRLESADNVGPSGIEINPHFSNDVGKAFIKLGVSPTSPSKTIVGTGSITGSDVENSFSISGNDIICSPNSNVTHRLSEKVNMSDVLEKTNTTEFTPMADYQPATKKYVDDAIKAAIEKYNTEAMTLLGED